MNADLNVDRYLKSLGKASFAKSTRVTNTGAETRLLKALRELKLIDEPRMLKILEDGSAFGYRNIGFRTYLILCKFCGAKPYEPPATGHQIKRSLRARIKSRINQRRSQIRKLEERLEEIDSAKDGLLVDYGQNR